MVVGWHFVLDKTMLCANTSLWSAKICFVASLSEICGTSWSVSLWSANALICSFLNDIDLVNACMSMRARIRAHSETAVSEDERGGAGDPNAGEVVRVSFKRWTPC